MRFPFWEKPLKPGDTVRARIPPNHDNPCIRAYDIPRDIIGPGAEVKLRRVVEKIFEDELCLVLEVEAKDSHHKLFAKVLSPRGNLVWIKADLLERVKL